MATETLHYDNSYDQKIATWESAFAELLSNPVFRKYCEKVQSTISFQLLVMTDAPTLDPHALIHSKGVVNGLERAALLVQQTFNEGKQEIEHEEYSKKQRNAGSGEDGDGGDGDSDGGAYPHGRARSADTDSGPEGIAGLTDIYKSRGPNKERNPAPWKEPDC